MKRKVLVLGHRGMLGSMAVSYFSVRGDDVVTLEGRFSVAQRDSFLEGLRGLNADVVVNAIGAIKQKVNDAPDLLMANAVLPLLVRAAMPPEALLVHPSTDCVFQGTHGRYCVTDPPDATDWYGLSKALGETVGAHPGTLVVRTSVIGPESHGVPSGLLGWFLAHGDGETLPGYENHFWNGLTTLEWCRFVSEQLDVQMRPGCPGKVVQPCSPGRLSKKEVLEAMNVAFQRRIGVRSAIAPEDVDRTLVPTEIRRPLGDQLDELARWVTA